MVYLIDDIIFYVGSSLLIEKSDKLLNNVGGKVIEGLSIASTSISIIKIGFDWFNNSNENKGLELLSESIKDQILSTEKMIDSTNKRLDKHDEAILFNNEYIAFTDLKLRIKIKLDYLLNCSELKPKDKD
jgi:hypothetical protein